MDSKSELKLEIIEADREYLEKQMQMTYSLFNETENFDINMDEYRKGITFLYDNLEQEGPVLGRFFLAITTEGNIQLINLLFMITTIFFQFRGLIIMVYWYLNYICFEFMHILMF